MTFIEKQHEGMKLLTAEILNRLPPFGKHDEDNPIVQAVFTFPIGAATWLALSGSPGDQIAPGLMTTIGNDDFLFYGVVTLDGTLWEAGEFTLNQLLEITEARGIFRVERIDAEPCAVSEYTKGFSRGTAGA